MRSLRVTDVARYANVEVLTDEEIQAGTQFLAQMLREIALGSTLTRFYADFDREEYEVWFSQNRLRFTLSIGVDEAGGSLSPGVVALQQQYQRARNAFTESKFDELLDMYDDPMLISDPRLASALKGKSDNIKWALSKLKPKKYGDKIQVEQTVNVDVVHRLHASRDRLQQLDDDTLNIIDHEER